MCVTACALLHDVASRFHTVLARRRVPGADRGAVVSTQPLLSPLRVVLVDDEALARARLRTLVGDLHGASGRGGGRSRRRGTGHGLAGSEHRRRAAAGHPHAGHGRSGAGTRTSSATNTCPRWSSSTAHTEHAVAAFEVEALDYLTKPVRLERLQQSLQKVERYRKDSLRLGANLAQKVLLIQDRGRAERIPVADVLFLKAELKYVTVQTARRSYILDGSLNELEARHSALFMRVHRNALVARHAMRALEKHVDAEEGEGWALRLHGTEELLAVSRRQLAAVREALLRPTP